MCKIIIWVWNEPKHQLMTIQNSNLHSLRYFDNTVAKNKILFNGVVFTNFAKIKSVLILDISSNRYGHSQPLIYEEKFTSSEYYSAYRKTKCTFEKLWSVIFKIYCESVYAVETGDVALHINSKVKVLRINVTAHCAE